MTAIAEAPTLARSSDHQLVQAMHAVDAELPLVSHVSITTSEGIASYRAIGPVSLVTAVKLEKEADSCRRFPESISRVTMSSYNGRTRILEATNQPRATPLLTWLGNLATEVRAIVKPDRLAEESEYV